MDQGRSLLIAVETKYVDSFSRDPANADADRKYDRFCREFGMADGAFDRLEKLPTRQLLRNVLLTESLRRGGTTGTPAFDEAITVVLARDTGPHRPLAPAGHVPATCVGSRAQ